MADDKERTLRQEIEAAATADEVLRSMPSPFDAADPPGTPIPNARPKPGENSTHSDRAVYGLCDLLGLTFALPFGEDLYHETSITGAHVAYLVAGLMLAVFGHMWPRIKNALPQQVIDTVTNAALDFRLWIVTLLVLFVVTIGPETYQRAVAPQRLAPSIAGATAMPPQQSKIAEDAENPRSLPFLLTDDPSRVIEATKRLAPGDRARLAEAVYDLAQLFEQANELQKSAASLRTLIYSEAQKGAIANAPGYINLINEAAKKIKIYQDQLSAVQRKYKYYDEQITFIIGANSANEMAGIETMLSLMRQYLQRWDMVSNKNDRAVQEIVELSINQTVTYMFQVEAWKSRFNEHLQAIKALVQ